MLSLYSRHLVKAGKVPLRHSKDLQRLFGFREAADYDYEFELDRAGAEEEAHVARRVIEEIRAFLRSEGWLEG